MKSFHAAGYRDWTLTHAFFADMGGFLLSAKDFDEPFPVNAAELFYLVSNDFVSYPLIRKAEIDDKNKSGGLARYGQDLPIAVIAD